MVQNGATSIVPVKPRELVNYWPKNGNFGPKFTRYAMPWFETYFFQHKKYPSDADIMERFGCCLEEVAVLNSHKFFLMALEKRGITPPGREEWYLSDRQVAAIAILTNFNIVQDPLLKLAQIGVTEEELNGWHQNPHFHNALQTRADTILDNVSADATTELARAIKNGNFPAIKFYYEITGRAQSPEAVNVKQAMTVLIEAVQKHVKDPAVLQAIAGEVQSLRSIQGL